jgi:ABC-type branched-subunit amino acid transport system ATPase component
MSVLIEIEGLSKTFSGFKALSDVGFAIPEGKITAVIGPNGAGKSTLFNLITGKLVPTSGAIRLRGRDITTLPPEARVRSGFGRTFQRTSVFGEMSVRENLRTALLCQGSHVWSFWRAATAFFESDVQALASRFELSDALDLQAKTMSHGDQKQLELAMAVAQTPKVLLLDEPLAGMSPVETRTAVAAIVDEVRQRGITLLFTEHDIDVVFEIADVIVVLDKGRLIASGPAAQIRSDARVQAVYLGQSDALEAPELQ